MHKTILVVEDEDTIRKIVSKSLRNDGYNVIEAQNPRRASQIMGSDLFSIDLLFADIVMPEMSGTQFAKELRAIRPDLKIIFATGSVDLLNTQELAAIPHNGLLEKPFTIEDLRDAVRSALGGRDKIG